MISINYQTFGKGGFQLRLRLYLNGETRYIAVTKLLKGPIQKKHWNQKKQLFIPSCPFSEENNDTLVKFKKKYQDAAIDWKGSVFGLVNSLDSNSSSIIVEEGGVTLHGFICNVVEELKQNRHPDGTIKGSYEGYVKLDRRLEEFCDYRNVDYYKLPITELNASFVNSVFDWVINVKKGSGHVYISAMLHAIVVRADKEDYVKIDDFKKCKWRGKNRGSVQKYNTLTSEQCKMFASLTLEDMPKNPKSELYRDFCTFILYTGQSACDAISLKYSDIQRFDGVDHFVFKRRKIAEKQAVPCSVPINPIMKSIMERWKMESRDGYIFPIRNKKKMKEQQTNNGDIKHFLCRLNVWLKKVGDIIGCNFPLHSYTFRHTAITHYISKGVPVVYVANLMGTSVKNCQDVYYNNRADRASRDKVMNAIMF